MKFQLYLLNCKQQNLTTLMDKLYHIYKNEINLDKSVI